MENKHQYWLGKKLSIEHRTKLSEAAKGKVISHETRNKISASMKGKKGYWLGKKMPEDVKLKMRFNQLNNKNKQRSENYNIKTRYVFITRFGNVLVCFKCKSTSFVDIHHLDFNHRNNSLENLVPLCRKCHRSYHCLLKKEGAYVRKTA